ncbi:cell division ATP-binding protein FtsE [bacterium]|nr:cell division ATP-binding protein FtsE [bacterium]MCI0616211.1 cell division ATP-binding protein FtsE [bacterium]
MIKMFHATKRYDQQYVALNDITLNVPKGQFAFLTGPSGAGKSTLLRLLIREEIATSGQIIVNGRNIAIIPDHQIPILRRNIGFVFQDFKLLKRKTVYENVTFVLHVIGASPRIQKKRAFEILKMVGLQHKMHSYPLQLSGGEQQRVAIARALINEPVLLLADEPTGNLDPDLALEIMQIFKRINARGTTVIIATHDKDMIQKIRGRVVILDHGRLSDDIAL